MSQDPTANGASASEPRERPSWYVPIKPVPPSHHKTLAEVFEETFEPLDLSEETQQELVAYLDQFRVPRDS